MVLLSITPLLDGVLRRDIIAPFHTSGPSLLQFHLAIEQWGLSTGQADLTTILPFPMTESFISLCCANSYWTNAGCDVSNTAITLSQAQTDKASTRHYGPLCWIVLGK